MDRPQEPPTAGDASPPAAVVDVPVGAAPNAGEVSAMISATIPSKRKRFPNQFFEAPVAAAASPAAASPGEAPPAAKKAGRMKTKAAGPRGAAPAKVRTKAISRIGLAPPPPSKATPSPPSVPSDAPPAPPPSTMDVDKVFDLEFTTSYMDMLNGSAVNLDTCIDAFDGECNVEEIDEEEEDEAQWKLRDNEPKCKKEALLTMDDEAEDMSGRNTGKPEGNKKAKESVKVELEAASFREKLDQLMKSKEELTMKTLETKLLITDKKSEVKLAKVQARREDAKLKAELDMKMMAAKEAKAMKELLAEERAIMMMRTDGMDEDQLAWWNETKADIIARKKAARQARAQVVIGQLFCDDDHEAAGLVGDGAGMPTRRQRGGKP
nr:uncharacterized protein LOC127310215 [Lolium perenne]